MKKLKENLDKLLEKEIITGYNYFRFPIYDNICLLSLSNMHETGLYLEEVLKELNRKRYLDNVVLKVRPKESTTKWGLSYRIRDDQNRVYSNLKIRRNGVYLDLEKIPFKTLEEADWGSKEAKNLIGETRGYEIILYSKTVKQLKDLAKLFLEKSKMGKIHSWKDAYDDPFIHIKGLNKVRGFEASKSCNAFTKGGELAFIIRNNAYIQNINLVKSLNFIISDCLLNKKPIA